MQPREQLALLLRGWRVIVVATVLAGALAYITTATMPKVYESQAKLIVAQSLNTPTPDINVLMASQRLTQTFAELATTRPLVQRVIDQLDLPDNADQLIARTTAQAAANSLYVTIAVRDSTPERAAATANALGAELIDAAPAILATAPTGPQPRLLTVVDPAIPDSTPVAPRITLTTVLAAIVAAIAAVGLIVAREYLNDTIRSGREAESATGAATLAYIERIRGAGAGRLPMYSLATLLFPRSSAAESFRTLRTSLDYASIDSGVRSIVVTSSVAGEGKTTVASNLAVVYAQSGRRTILVDADFRQPAIADTFRLAEGLGLTDLLLTEDLRLDVVLRKTEEPNLMVLTSGPQPPNPADLVGTLRMRTVLGLLRDHAEIVIIDTPPLSVTDGAVLGAAADGTLLVVRVGKVRRNVLAARREALNRVGAHLLGVVLNDLPENGEYDAYSEPISDSSPVPAS
jgi:capsular exopolysaccharide synthesis family protein